jgi:hypothetical protein
MKTRIPRRWAAPAGVLLALGTTAAVVPTAAAAIDPSAYGVWAVGPAHLSPTPAVDWSAGAGVSSSSNGAGAPGLSIGAGRVTAGNGYATADQHGVRYGAVTIASAIAACHDGRTISHIRVHSTDGTIESAGAKHAATVGDLTIRTDVVTRYADGSTSVAAAVITGPGGEQITVALARCGPSS